MALSCSKTIKELQAEIERLGLSLPEKEKLSKEDYIVTLQAYYENSIQKGEGFNFRNGIELALANRYDEYKESQKKEFWSNPDWVAQKKFDGVRCLITVFPNSDNVRLWSRHLSIENYFPIEFSDRIPFFLKEHLLSLGKSFVLDVEITSKEKAIFNELSNLGLETVTQLQAVTSILSLNSEASLSLQEKYNYPLFINIFDCLYFEGSSLIEEPYRKRYEIYMASFKDLPKKFFYCVPIVFENKKEFLEELLENGEEGIILKNLNSSYNVNSSRVKSGMVKVKRTLSGALNDTIDAWVSGWEPGAEGKGFENLVGALCFSVYIQEPDGSLTEHLIAKCANLDLSFRKMITAPDGTLKKEMYEKVFEIDGQAISGRALRFKHARIIRYRPEKSKEECTILKREFIESQIL